MTKEEAFKLAESEGDRTGMSQLVYVTTHNLDNPQYCVTLGTLPMHAKSLGRYYSKTYTRPGWYGLQEASNG